MTLYIVPPDGGKGGAPSALRGRRGSVVLTRSESAALRAALKNLNQKHTWEQLAAMLGVCRNTVRFVGNGRAPGSAGLALRVARLAGLGIERVLDPGPAPIASCPHCGGALEGT